MVEHEYYIFYLFVVSPADHVEVACLHRLQLSLGVVEVRRLRQTVSSVPAAEAYGHVMKLSTDAHKAKQNKKQERTDTHPSAITVSFRTETGLWLEADRRRFSESTAVMHM